MNNNFHDNSDKYLLLLSMLNLNNLLLYLIDQYFSVRMTFHCNDGIEDIQNEYYLSRKNL